ncbi:MAG: prepilin-type N-terminal cleavage/methylation domain-containing protein, partial [Chthoniobacteraceae bacterium]|nr:prepilin-type N-terminal cleavage/methylation domain-containing protein [Chthoniobacteraceae bacterium]
GFTLLELISAMVVLGILATLSFPLYSNIRAMMEGKQCETNLRGLGAGMSAFLADHSGWPQIPPDNNEARKAAGASPQAQENSPAGKWIAALKDYGVPEQNWHCPTVSRQILTGAKPEASKYKRLDYVPTNFGLQENPRQWPEHPWFIERGSYHGSGPNLLLADGTVTNVDKLFQKNR